ncbi:MAG: OmpA family protein [Polyangiaceae bacterium]
MKPSPSHCTPRHLLRGTAALIGCALAALACGPMTPTARPSPFDRGVDEDGDSVPDSEDACPAELEDGLAPKPNDGCLSPDPDRDGIPTGQDRCPDAKEDRLFPKPNDGCPIADADHDGVGNTEDRCTDLAEDNQDPDPGDGCPAPDADADGIVDVNDKCPNEAETINGYRDADGCPDASPKTVVFDPESSEIVIPEAQRAALFAETSSLSPEAQATLAEVAKILAANPQIERLEIEAHTATRGDAAYNLQVTSRRADTLAHALIRIGVTPGRLVPIGFGEQCPAVNRGDDVEEPRNRRVAFKAVLVSGLWQTIPRGCWRAQAIGIDPTRVKAEIMGDPI